MMTMIPAVLLQEANPAGGLALLGISSAALLVILAISLVCIAGLWKVFTKAGQPGWAVLIPFYNTYILLKIAGRPGWWLVLYLIPIVNFIIIIIVAIDIAKAFGQSTAWGVIFLVLLSAIGYLMLGFGSYRYTGPSTQAVTA